VVPAVVVASYVPVSISGIGVREVALVELFGQAGVPAAGALTVSLLIFAISMVLSLAGGLVYLSGTKAPPG
jgi:glycosyltransferase 2 family protein